MISVTSATSKALPKDKSDLPKDPKVQESSELEKLNARLSHISKKILSASPYLLTVPSDRPYNINPHQANDWRRQTPFDVNEEQLQYMSFLNREFDDGLIRAVGGWDNDKGELMDTIATAAHGSRSGTTTPRPGQAPGKKISLAEYKNKKAASQSTSKDSSSIDRREMKQEKTLNTAKVEAVVGPRSLPPKSERPTQSHGQKRSADAIVDSTSTAARSGSSVPVHPPKKARTSPPPSLLPTSKSSITTTSSRPSIPSLLSPTLPALVEEELSRMARGTTSEIEKSKHKKTSSFNSLSSSRKSDGHSSRPSQELNETKRKEVDQTNKHIRTKSSISSDSVKQSEKTGRGVDAGASARKVLSHGTTTLKTSPHRQDQTSIKPRPADDKPAYVEDLVAPRKSLIVTLKISKARRKDFARLVQMKPQPNRSEQSKLQKQGNKVPLQNEPDRKLGSKAGGDRASDRPEPRILPESQKSAPSRRNEVHIKAEALASRQPSLDSTKVGDKRLRKDDEKSGSAPQSKRQKQPSGLDLAKKPSTPIPPAFKSPVISHHGSANKLRPSTPSSDSRPASSSRRLDAAESDVKTPQGSARDVTPLAPGSVEKITRAERSASNTSSLTSSNSTSSETDKLWRAEQNKYYNLGRSLKHETDALFKSFDTTNDPQTEKKAMATAVETVLCFMLAYTINDEQGRSVRRLADVKAWETIFGWMHNVKRKTFGQTLLHGLCLQLEAVVRTIIRSSDLERLDSLPLPTNIPAEVKLPTPDTNGDSTARDLPSKSAPQQQDKYEEYLKFKAKVVDNHRLAQQLWITGSFELSIEDLQSAFPHSWGKKARAPLAHSREKLTPTTLNGDFYLPMSGVTTGIEAVRAGWSLLGEWCKKEKVEWKGQLGL